MFLRRKARRRKQIEIEVFEEYAKERADFLRKMHAENQHL
jgi:hypothetical protein